MRYQQDRLYDAEESSGVYPGAPIDDPQAWVNAKRDTWWWARWYWSVGYVNVTVTRRDVDPTGTYDHADGCGYVTLPRDYVRTGVLVHELVHVVAGKLHGSHAHDPWFAREYLNLTYLILGSDAYDQLRAAYVDHGVEFDAKITTGDRVA